jgi:Acetyltransferases
MHEAVRLDPLTEADFGVVAALADTIWRSHYGAMISMAQIDYMLDGRYAAENLRRYVDADDRWLWLLRVDGEAVGYCSCSLGEGEDEMKLEQLYLLPSLHGRGLGGRMLRHVEAQGRTQGRDVLWLTVNKGNAGSIAVYRKAGFAVRREAVFDIGHGYVMDDYVMAKRLGA